MDVTEVLNLRCWVSWVGPVQALEPVRVRTFSGLRSETQCRTGTWKVLLVGDGGVATWWQKPNCKGT